MLKLLSRVYSTWARAANALLHERHLSEATDCDLLADLQDLLLAADPFAAAFPPPSAQSKAAFETKTSAINVTPQSIPHDISEIKDDTLWLSNEVHLDEIGALRLVVEERQSRSTTALLGPLTTEETIAITDAAGHRTETVADGIDPTVIEKESNTVQCRRRQLLQLYLAEREGFWQCFSRFIVIGNQQSSSRAKAVAITGRDDAQPTLCGPEQIWVTLLDRQTWISPFTKAIRSNVESLNKGPSGWLVDGCPSLEIELSRGRNLLVESILAMEIIMQVLMAQSSAKTSSLSTLHSPETVLEWLNTMQACNFLDIFDSVRVLMPCTFTR